MHGIEQAGDLKNVRGAQFLPVVVDSAVSPSFSPSHAPTSIEIYTVFLCNEASRLVQLAPTFPSLHDLTERSADLTPRLAGCDARVVFRFELGSLSLRDPLFSRYNWQICCHASGAAAATFFAASSGGVHIDPTQDGADVAFAVMDPVRTEMLHRVRLSQLLTPARAESRIASNA